LASNKPVIHGRDHLPGGADPIPERNYSAVATAGPALGNETGGWSADLTSLVTGSPAVTLHAANDGIDIDDYGVFLVSLELVLTVNPTTISKGVSGSILVVDAASTAISTGFDAVVAFESPDPSPNTVAQNSFHGHMRFDLSRTYIAPFWMRGSFQFDTATYDVSYYRMAISRIGPEF
jgi:hypothetical protein